MRRYIIVHKGEDIHHLTSYDGDLGVTLTLPGYESHHLSQQTQIDFNDVAANPGNYRVVPHEDSMTIEPKTAMLNKDTEIG